MVLALSFLIGLEREEHKASGEQYSFGGVRTFPLIGLIGYASETVLEAFAQLNRYGRLVVEFDGGPDRFKVTRARGSLWVIDARQNPNAFPELTESTFARLVCGPRHFGVTQVVDGNWGVHAIIRKSLFAA